MATKKVAPKKAPAGKTTGKSLAKWDAQLAALAQQANKTEASVGGGGQFISTRGGRLQFDGAEIPGNKMNVIVIDHIIEYLYYGDSYDAENPQAPLAFAFGRDEDEMRWHENSIPEYAGELCKDSDINQWGSADKGKGKACKNIRRLAIITEDQLDDLESAVPTYIKVPVTSVKGWAGYVRQLSNTLGRPPLAVVTEISLIPDPKTQFKMQFKLVEEIDDGDVIGGLIAMNEKVSKEIDFPYQPADAEEEAPRGNKNKAQVRKAIGKPAKKVVGKAAPAKKPAGKAAPEPAKKLARKY